MRSTLIFIALSILFSYCAPVFSEMQSAKMLPKGGVEATGLYSNTAFADDGESGHVQNHLGVRLAYGVNDRLNVRMAYENIFEEGIESVHVIGFGPKIPIIKDRIAFFLPVGTAFGENISTADAWQIQPTALFTVPIVDNIEFNPSAKWLLPLSEGSESLVAVNFGAGLSTDINRWAVRPEIGLLYNPGESGHFTHYSIGFTFYPSFADPCCPQKLRRNR